jgi:hypothetical protein
VRPKSGPSSWRQTCPHVSDSSPRTSTASPRRAAPPWPPAPRPWAVPAPSWRSSPSVTGPTSPTWKNLIAAAVEANLAVYLPGTVGRQFRLEAGLIKTRKSTKNVVAQVQEAVKEYLFPASTSDEINANELRKALAANGVPAGGKKSDLVARGVTAGLVNPAAQEVVSE